MREEALQAAEVCARQMAADGARVAALASALRQAPPTALLTIARGSSDHAAAYMAYLVMARLGRPVTSLPMRDRKSTRLNSSHSQQSRMPSSA